MEVKTLLQTTCLPSQWY